MKRKISNLNAFTLAEVLIVIGIIGIIASLTIPTLVKNYQKAAYVAGLKKGISASTQFFKQILADTECTDLMCTGFFQDSGPDLSVCHFDPDNMSAYQDCINNAFAEANSGFIGEMKKYFSMSKFCTDHSCEEKVTRLDDFLSGGTPSSVLFSGSKSDPTFITNDGMSFLINKLGCAKADASYNTKIKYSCASVTFDVNGPKKPNVLGVDIYEFVVNQSGDLFPSFGIEYSMNAEGNLNRFYWRNNPAVCGDPDKMIQKGEQVNGYACAARIMENGWSIDYY